MPATDSRSCTFSRFFKCMLPSMLRSAKSSSLGEATYCHCDSTIHVDMKFKQLKEYDIEKVHAAHSIISMQLKRSRPPHRRIDHRGNRNDDVTQLMSNVVKTSNQK